MKDTVLKGVRHIVPAHKKHNLKQTRRKGGKGWEQEPKWKNSLESRRNTPHSELRKREGLGKTEVGAAEPQVREGVTETQIIASL